MPSPTVDASPNAGLASADLTTSPFDWESAIAALLADLADVQGDLLQVLQHKQAALAAADVSRLAELQPQEEHLAERLERCHRRRAELLTAARRQGLPSVSVGRLAAHVIPGSSRARVQQAAAQMRLLKHHSFSNWVLAQRSLLHVSQLLEIIATGGRMQPTYGDKDSLHSRGSLVDQDG